MTKNYRFFLAAFALMGATSCASAQETQTQVRFKTGNKYIGTVSGGKKLEITSRKQEQQVFTLVDLNGGDVADGDAVKVKYVPGPPSAPNFWLAREGELGRGDAADTFTLKKSGDSWIVQTADGKWVGAPASSKGAPLLISAEQDALKLAIVPLGAPATDAATPPATDTAATNRGVPVAATDLAAAWMTANRAAKPKVEAAPADGKSAVDFGAVGDGKTLNTQKIQAAIDGLAAKGGTLIFPKGIFLSGALFLKKGVNLYLAEGAVIKGSTDTKDYPMMKTRIEGHFEPWLPALINADGADNLRITGAGTLDGSGPAFWKGFWARFKADPATTNLDVPRPRLALIQNSKNVQIRGITFKDSGFWNLHLYKCQQVTVENARFEVQVGAKAASSDGIDVDSSQNVTVRGCNFRVDDDCVAMKGSKGPLALEDKDSPPVENVRVENCVFERGHGVLVCGSEATVVRDVVVENCLVTGKIPLVRLKLRPDTPQNYGDIHFRDITLTGTEHSFKDEIFDVRPWTQFFDLKGQTPPQSTVKNVTLTGIKGTFGSWGEITGNPGQTTISDITVKNVDVQLTKNAKIKVGEVKNLKFEDVKVNGKPFTR